MGSHEGITKILEDAALAGGHAILTLLEAGVKVEANRKADDSLVLNLDLASQEAMHRSLNGAGPVVSEEDPASHSLIVSGGSYFLADPLDGTSSCRRSLLAYGKFVPGQVGFGPIAGYVENGRMVAAAFFNLPDRMLYTATLGEGSFVVEVPADCQRPQGAARCRMTAREQSALVDAAVLFYPGTREEIELAFFLKSRKIIDALYRFGSFANDCTRVARGYEQVELQLAPRAWDLPAALIASEAGCSVIVDPLGRAILLEDWEVTARNPVCIVAPGLEQPMREGLAQYTGRP
jgi:fructose-1,6-bisphosphatase/inositol monophosphatase family enzyme